LEYNLNLIDIWIGLLGLAVILYVVLDGFSLGIALLFPFSRSDEERDVMIESIAPVWDANQTWLVFSGGGLFVAFPLLYGVLFSGLYIPLFTLLYGLIFRGVSFEFRAASARKRTWDRSFFWGSIVAVVAQGCTLGGIISGVKTVGGNFAGGPFDWLTPFSMTAAAGLVAGYMLLGSAYLIIKTTGTVQERAYGTAYCAAFVVLVFQAAMILWTPFYYPEALKNWLSTPRVYFIWIFPVISVLAFFGVIRSVRKRREILPFLFGVIFFFAGYLGLFASLYPYALPPDITFYEAAAERETLRFTLWGAALILPVVISYSIYSYMVFRGKVRREGYQS
jgi:cytochrome d ubiquinol oxidase subunit II